MHTEDDARQRDAEREEDERKLETGIKIRENKRDGRSGHRVARGERELVWRQHFGPAMRLDLARTRALTEMLQHLEDEDAGDGGEGGGSDGRVALRATEDKDEAVQNEAVRTLSSWPNTWPEDAGVTEPLLKVARSDTNSSHQVLALRGYLEFLRGDKKLKSEEKAAKLQEVLPLLQRPEEKRSAIGVIRELPATAGLPLLVKLAEETAVADDACTAIVDTASKDRPGVSRETRQNALQTVLDKSSSEATKKKAEDALKKLTNS